MEVLESIRTLEDREQEVDVAVIQQRTQHPAALRLDRQHSSMISGRDQSFSYDTTVSIG